MPRWQDTYDALTGERYADLLAYSLLVEDDAELAQSRLAQAMHAVLSHGRRVADADEAEAQVRAEVVRAVVAAAPQTAAPPQDAPHSLGRDPEPSVFAPPTAAAPAASHEQSQAEPHAHQSLADTLDHLDARTRAVTILHHHDGHSVRRIAELTGMRPEEITTRLGAAGAQLSARTGLDAASTAQDDQFAGVEMTVTTEPTRPRRG